MTAKVPRKLLILDLNGTLLLRSKHTRPARPLSGPGMRTRTVHPRPYLQPLREYIFHPSTMLWLDTMVWSSAQPHSVADMVNSCFGTQQRKFLAIWARDTLGIPPALYHQKTQTTKDLRTPWGAFPAHDARTTLLLDDSVRKAHLHPFNHVCVEEYLQETRARDLEVWEASHSRATPLSAKRLAKNAKKATSKTKVDVDVKESAPPRAATYDETLLAVVGILETLKTEADVAEWIRGGGLWGDSARPPSPSPNALAVCMDALDLAPEPWFSSTEAVKYWAAQGVHALEALQIDVAAGIHGGH
ncbi:hypothetical protein B0H15DRAFT_770143 [Mycena belliarum]|uniref:Mitochondrial import inner membrane translocase subunit TIM50 n=1 Tax=Mycena belliarum TaxID=1033014 RepID=A0AAD6UFJ8_9AGAR|nr:hypothetical protein B0H15DRAFT_770143 [Mycena belliae]